MSGLRSQRERMMTCLSLRSGVTSSGMLAIAHHPATQARAARAKTANLWRAEKSMTLLIIPVSVAPAGRFRSVQRNTLRHRQRAATGMRRRRWLQTAFRVNQKRSGRHDVLSGLQTLQNLDSFAGAPTRLHVARLEHVLSTVDIDASAASRVNHRVYRNSDRRRHTDR